MPHQCTNCGYTFPDGSKEMLSGCPDCGGNKFQYHPDEAPESPDESAEPPERPDPEGGLGAVGRAADTVRDFVGRDQNRPATPDRQTEDNDGSATPNRPAGVDDRPDATDRRRQSDRDEGREGPAPAEDEAQATARSEVVDEADLPDPSAVDDGADAERTGPPGEGTVVSEPDGPAPDISELREQLNDQFESIRILEPGQYELNLMELYDREEYIIALQENGRYVIEVPDAWRDDPTE